MRIVPERLDAYSRALPLEEIEELAATSFPDVGEDAEVLAAFVLALDAINFGSGYFPYLSKLPGSSGYRTIEAALREHFQSAGPLSATDLSSMEAGRTARLLGQHPAREPVAELMRLYAESWRDLGDMVVKGFDGSFAALVASAGGSAEALVRTLLEMPLYWDIARYDGLSVPFLKRAQLTTADLAAALPEDLGRFGDLERLTLFADNLVPHVLRVDGVLEYESGLLQRIESGERIAAGSPEEVEIRACAVHAAELLVARASERGVRLSAGRLDCWLWTRGAGPLYKSQPRHRTRTTAY